MKRSSHSDLSCADFPAVLTVRLLLTLRGRTIKYESPAEAGLVST